MGALSSVDVVDDAWMRGKCVVAWHEAFGWLEVDGTPQGVEQASAEQSPTALGPTWSRDAGRWVPSPTPAATPSCPSTVLAEDGPRQALSARAHPTARATRSAH